MGHDDIYNPISKVKREAHCSSMEQYHEMISSSIKEPERFWGEIAKQFYFKEECPNKFLDYNFDCNKGKIYIKWMEGAKTNICYNCLDRHVLSGGGDKIAFYWEGNDPADFMEITYKSLLEDVCRVANVLKDKGIKNGDRVALYMPMIPELVIAMLAVARIGAVHSIVFGGYSAESLSDRMIDAKTTTLITADGVWRGSKLIHLKDITDEAISLCSKEGLNVKLNLVVKHMPRVTPPSAFVNGSGGEKPTKRPHFDDQAISHRMLPAATAPSFRPWNQTISFTAPDQALHFFLLVGRIQVNWNSEVDVWWDSVISNASTECPVDWVDAEHPLFMLYTSGSTGKPKGVLHTVGGYMLYTATTFKYTFDYHPGDVYFCTADIGWITGHSYVTYGPLLNNATSVLFEGLPTYPYIGRFWEIIQKYKVNSFYTAPTAIRALMKFGDEPVQKYDLSTLKVLGSVGEPINPEAWLWYYRVVGRSDVSVVDTFWQTETGGHVITPLPGATPTKPGSACFPFFGIEVDVVDEGGEPVKGDTEGYLVFRRPWPGMMRTVYGNHERFETTYFKKFPGCYCTGDGARRDKDGYIWVTGRIDDMLNVSGHLLSTAQVESALVEHESVAEAAAVARPHNVKGECLYCFVTLAEGKEFNDALVKQLREKVRAKIGPFAQPDFVQRAPGLPKTRSGKIMRRVLRKIAVGDHDLGDISTLADPHVVEALFELRPKEASNA